MVDLLAIGVTYHTPQNRVSETITHVILYAMNGVLSVLANCFPMFSPLTILSP